MENASKALLIAASVLIAILLIAFGIRIFNSVSNTSESATQLGSLLSDNLGTASAGLIGTLDGVNIESMDDTSFYEYVIKKYTGKENGTEVKSLYNIVKLRTGAGLVYGWVINTKIYINKESVKENDIEDDGLYNVKFTKHATGQLTVEVK